mmetsp:Transcript_39040/g.112148  ORF Transcript_39040/g.112148 Transcript_39040/m.112148 type:complete len:292 (+) Transcript_39040:687-1562(+)
MEPVRCTGGVARHRRLILALHVSGGPGGGRILVFPPDDPCAPRHPALPGVQGVAGGGLGHLERLLHRAVDRCGRCHHELRVGQLPGVDGGSEGVPLGRGRGAGRSMVRLSRQVHADALWHHDVVGLRPRRRGLVEGRSGYPRGLVDRVVHHALLLHRVELGLRHHQHVLRRRFEEPGEVAGPLDRGSQGVLRPGPHECIHGLGAGPTRLLDPNGIPRHVGGAPRCAQPDAAARHGDEPRGVASAVRPPRAGFRLPRRREDRLACRCDGALQPGRLGDRHLRHEVPRVRHAP